MKAATVYRIDGLLKKHGNDFALRIDDLKIERGEVFCVVGPTGAGKSTLLRILAALERPTAGRVTFGEHDLYANSLPLDVRRRITKVFQRPLLLSGTTGSNIEYPLRLRGLAYHDRAQRVMEQLRLLELKDRPAHVLSGGQTQLVALARALVIEPEVLLLDEPTANLDPAHVALVEEVMCEFQSRFGSTIVWATHNQFQARRVANRVALMLDGRLAEVSDTTTFFDNPVNPKTAAFVQGKMVY